MACTNVVGSDEAFSGQTIDICKSVVGKCKSGTVPELPGQVEGVPCTHTVQIPLYVFLAKNKPYNISSVYITVLYMNVLQL